MNLRDYRPHPQLVVKQTTIEQPRFPVIDAHNHLGPTFGGDWIERPIEELIDIMDAAHVTTLVDLDGGWGEDVLEHHLDHFKAAYPDRFMHFGGVDWDQWVVRGGLFPKWAAERLRAQVGRGAQGLKIWKPFGLTVRDNLGQVVAVDDERLDPIWAAAGELNIPVMIHVGDPVAFFEPLDVSNERWEELQDHPTWHFPAAHFPAFMTIMEGLRRLVRRHYNTTFIGAHVGCYAENLAWVGALLDEAPNFYVDISARLGELGRQPYGARRFFLQYADRILFGTDHSADVDAYRLYYRFLETDDEYFNYSLQDPPPQGRWRIYGVFLPDEVLQQVYHQNARRVLGLNTVHSA